MIEQLLELRATDTAADQLRHRRAQLPELAAASAAREALVAWERRRTGLRDRIAGLDERIARSESESEEIDAHRTRLEAQLKTVIAPREAEALQHEIATLTERREALDDDELEALEEQSTTDDELSAHLLDEERLRAEVASTDAALAAVESDLAAEEAQLAARREELRGELPAELVARYDRLRAQHGVAVAELVGSRCDGCHLDLSAAEVDTVKRTATDGLGDCPQCGRILVV